MKTPENSNQDDPTNANSNFAKKNLPSQHRWLLHISYLNKRFKEAMINDFKSLYYIECQLCNDIIFDPVYCEDCMNMFCLSCVRDKEKVEAKYQTNFIKCKHYNLSDLPKQKQQQLRAIELSRCFFECETENLNLLNYGDHTRECIKVFQRNLELITKKQALRI